MEVDQISMFMPLLRNGKQDMFVLRTRVAFSNHTLFGWVEDQVDTNPNVTVGNSQYVGISCVAGFHCWYVLPGESLRGGELGEEVCEGVEGNIKY